MNRMLRNLVTVLLVLLTVGSAFVVAFPAAASPDAGPTGTVSRGSSSPAAPTMPDVDPMILEYLKRRPATPD